MFPRLRETARAERCFMVSSREMADSLMATDARHLAGFAVHHVDRLHDIVGGSCDKHVR